MLPVQTIYLNFLNIALGWCNRYIEISLYTHVSTRPTSHSMSTTTNKFRRQERKNKYSCDMFRVSPTVSPMFDVKIGVSIKTSLHH